jgi:tetratricopeptide (TPR) repeat protein
MENDVHTALRYHQRGLLDQAGLIYQGVLARDPDNADTLHLLGVLEHQRGRHARAAELIGRAVALNPGAAAYHANLAEVHRALGRLDRAAAACRTALSLQPEYPEAANNLGLTLLAQGQTDDAAAQFRWALRLRPDYAMAWNNLGSALRSQGDKAAARDHFRQALALDPGLAEAHSNLGQLLLEHKELEESLAHCREALRLRPHFAEAHSNLGNALRELGRLEEARAAYAEALRLNPGLAMAVNNVGQALQEEGRLVEAISWYQRALQMEPSTARFHANLAGALEEQQKHDEASACYQLALRLDPGHAESHNGLGWVRHEQGRYDEARKHYEDALRLDPALAAAHGNLGTLLEELSDFDAAERCFREALGHDGRQAGALAQLATLRRGRLPEADRAAMRRLLADPHLPGGKRSALHFGLAQVLDAEGNYAEAADHLRRANALALAEWRKRGQEYDPAAHARFVAGMTAACTPEFFARVRGWGLESERPVFIVGLPRSGTTLIEQVLGGHSQVFAAGELPLGHEDFQGLPGDGEADPPERLGRLDGETARRLGQRHLDRLAELNRSAPRVVDKMPDNYLSLGLLAALFPKARFIHCRRDLRDVAVSCWMTNFRQIRWANDPDHIAGRFREYERLTAHWRQVLPVPVLEVAYEETVADLEGVAGRLVAWCGLDWEPACLAFHQGRRPVRTASVSQVRQPISTRSVGRWKQYEPSLAPLFARLENGSGEDGSPGPAIGKTVAAGPREG